LLICFLAPVRSAGTATFTNPTVTDLFNSPSAWGILQGNAGTAVAILYDENPSFSTFSLSSPGSGPITGTAVFNPGFAFATDSGAFVLTSVSNVTFEGPATVPEPSTFALLGMATASFAGYFGWRRRKATAPAAA
jgi:hypothetical protein